MTRMERAVAGLTRLFVVGSSVCYVAVDIPFHNTQFRALVSDTPEQESSILHRFQTNPVSNTSHLEFDQVTARYCES